jgi:Citrate synthase
MAEEHAKLTLPSGEVLELPVYQGTTGPDVVDVSGLLKSGYFTYDPGFMSTAATESKITYIDGDQGILLHRGFDRRSAPAG